MSEEEVSNITVEAALPKMSNRARFIFKTIVFAFEICLIIALIFWWLSSHSAQESQNLWVLFFISFPAEFLIATVPHEPVLLYFAKYYSPLVIALVAVAGTVLVEILNYSVFNYIIDLRLFQKISQNKWVGKMVALFGKAPFAALWVAGFTPIPFYPFRFLVVFAHYPLLKYILAVVLSRTPRFYLLALIGQAIKLSDFLLLIITAILIVAANIPILKKLIKRKQPKKLLTVE
jgi:membrane protein YqaA with SNARE-associated domain